MTTRTDDVALLTRHVGHVLARLQGGYLPSGGRARPTSEAVQRLAVLRRADLAHPERDPDVWPITLAGIPETLLHDHGGPSRAERAVHAVLGLYAVHQQSRPSPMHLTGGSLGTAVRDLARRRSADGDLDEATLRRFRSVATATGSAQRLHFLRGLVTLLRSESIPLDYVRLAADLYWLEVPRRADLVRLTWGRDLHRLRSDPNNPKPTGTNPSEKAGTAS